MLESLVAADSNQGERNARCNRACWRRMLCAAAVLIGLFVWPPTSRADLILTLADRQQIYVQRIASETDRHQLSIQVQADGIRITRHIPWSNIVRAEVNSQVVSTVQLRRIVVANAQTGTAAATEFSLTSAEEMEWQPPATGEDKAAADESTSPIPALPVDTEDADSQIERAPAPMAVDRPMPHPGNFAEPMCEPAFPPPFPPGSIGFPMLDAVIVGIRPDPLGAYADLMQQNYPFGIPAAESAFALDLMRSRKARDVLYAPPFADVVVPPFEAEPAAPPLPADEVPAAGTVTAIRVDAAPFASGGHVDLDSLAVIVHGVDHLGRPVPVRGTLKATLRGYTRKLVRGFGGGLLERPRQTKSLASWTRQLNLAPSQPWPAGASLPNNAGSVLLPSEPSAMRILLPLPHPLADHDLKIAPLADLHVRVLVPGVGTFEATAADVPIRQISRYRYQSRVERGSAFHPHEMTRDNRMRDGLLFEATSSLRPRSRFLSVQP